MTVHRALFSGLHSTINNTMNKHQIQNYIRVRDRLTAWGFTSEEIDKLFRGERTLSRWSELECNGNIQRDEGTDLPRYYYELRNGEFVRGKSVIPDREKGALARLAKLMSAHPDYGAYNQGDPRGCALYIYPIKALEGRPIGSYYTSVGVAICV
jgi:hypothetical protein